MKEKIKFLIYILAFAIFMVISTVSYKKAIENNNKKQYSANEVKSNLQKSNKIKEFEVYVNKDEKINIKSLIGKPIVINIWTSWCKYCSIEMPYFNELYLKEKDNINFMMINVTADRDSIESADQFINENNCDFKPYYDLNLDAVKALKIYSYPTTIFVDKEGYINSIKIGTITKEELVNKIEELK